MGGGGACPPLGFSLSDVETGDETLSCIPSHAEGAVQRLNASAPSRRFRPRPPLGDLGLVEGDSRTLLRRRSEKCGSERARAPADSFVGEQGALNPRAINRLLRAGKIC